MSPAFSGIIKNMSTIAERQRPRLFRRAEDKPIHELNERDMQLLRHIRRHRLIASDDLALLDRGSDLQADTTSLLPCRLVRYHDLATWMQRKCNAKCNALERNN
jgi:hypothetical protein